MLTQRKKYERDKDFQIFRQGREFLGLRDFGEDEKDL